MCFYLNTENIAISDNAYDVILAVEDAAYKNKTNDTKETQIRKTNSYMTIVATFSYCNGTLIISWRSYCAYG